MNYHGNLASQQEDDPDDVDDIFLNPGDAIEVMGKRFVVEGKSKKPFGFIVSDPDAPGSEQKFTNKHIKALWRTHKLRFVSQQEHGLPIGIRQSLRQTLRAFKPEERQEMFRRMRYCKAVDNLGNRFSRSEAGLTPAIQEVAAERNDSNPPYWATLYRWWQVWARSGRDVRALCPSNRRRGNRTPRLPEYMQRALKKGEAEWLKPSQPNKRTAYNKVVSHCVDHHGGKEAVEKLLLEDPDAYLWPSYRTFCTFCDRGDRTRRILNRKGAARARAEMYPVGVGPEATFPLERVEADFKYLRIFVTDEKTGLPLGTPYLMGAIDCYSGVVVGFDLGFDPPSYVSAARCLKHIIEPKDLSKFPKDEDGIPLIRRPYPVNGLPHQFFLDNDAVFHSRSFEESALALGCNVDFVPPGHPWEKGKIERFWLSLQTAYLDMFPGKVLRIGKSDPQEYDPQKDAKLTLAELKLLITKAIVDVHHEGIEPDTDRHRIDLWNEGVAVHPPRLAPDSHSLIELVGAYATRRAERRGIRMFGLRYNSHELAVYRSGFTSDPRVEIRYDPQDISRIYIIDPDLERPLEVPCTKPDYVQGLSEHQHRVIRRHAAERSPKGRIRMKMLELARMELFELGKQLIGGRNKIGVKSKIMRFLGADRGVLDEMNRGIKDETENDPVDLKIDDPEDEALARQDEAVVEALQAEKKKSGQSPGSRPKPEVQTPPRRPRSHDGGMAGTPVAAEVAQHPPAQPQEQVLVAEPTPPSMQSQPSPVESPMQAMRPRRHRDRTLKVTSSES